MLSLLLLKGANVKAVDRKERTALHFAAFMGELCA
jgi:ankyrin repeat protein